MSDQIKANPLNLEGLKSAVAGTAAAFRCRRRLQPGGGEGDKVFPPTYAGAVYAVEKRRVSGSDDPVTCVLLDSVQSQANRMEQALQEAMDAGEITIPTIAVDFSKYGPEAKLDSEDEPFRLLDAVGRITALQAPHRLADAILRDSEIEETIDGEKTFVPFRASALRKRIAAANLSNATSIFESCPTALIFGMWDSTGPKGGLGAKFERAMVSEVVGCAASFGVKTASRIDPIISATKGITVYLALDSSWTTEASEALRVLSDSLAKKLKASEKAKLAFVSPVGTTKDKWKLTLCNKDGNPVETREIEDGKLAEDVLKGEPAKLRDGKVSQANLGNVTPDYERYDQKAITSDNRLTPDPMRTDGGFIEAKRIRPGGITVDYAEQITTLSLIAIRRLRFPVTNPNPDQIAVNLAARTVLAALGLCAATLAFESGMGLRSRCLLWPDGPMEWELLAKPGEPALPFSLTADNGKTLVVDAVAAAKQAGIEWRADPLILQPTKQLLDLVRKSQLQTAKSGEEPEGD